LKEVLRDRRMALAITLIIMILSMLTGTERSLNKIRQPIADMFYTDMQGGNNYAIEHSLTKRIGHAANLITVAGKFLPDGDKNLIFLTDARKELTDAAYMYEKYAANRKLTDAAVLVCIQLESVEAARDSDFMAILANLEESDRAVSYEADIYNEKVRGYNRRLTVFPGIITKAFGMTPALELFEEVAN